MGSSVLDYIDKFEDRQKKVVSERKKIKKKVIQERKVVPPIPKALRERRVMKKEEEQVRPVQKETKLTKVYERTMNHATDILDGLPEQQPQEFEFEDPILAEQMGARQQPKPITPSKIPDEIKSPEDMSNYASALL